MDFSRGLTCIQESFYCRCTNVKQQFTDKYFRAIGIADKMKSVRLVQIFRPIKETNRTHSKGYVEDLSTQSGRKRCAKMAVLNLSVLPIIHAGVVNSGRRLVSSREEAILVTLYDFLSFIFLVTICIVALKP